jgi:DNA-binding Lrp family transcriptional regulator
MMSEKTAGAQIDDFDRAILRVLQTENGTPQRVIAEQVGLSAPAVQRRIARLEGTGVITANVAVIDPEAVGQPVTAIIAVGLREDRTPMIERASRFFAAEPAVQQCYFVNGGETVIIVLSAASLSHFDSLLRRLFGDNEDVATYRTFIVLNRVKVGLSVPI